MRIASALLLALSAGCGAPPAAGSQDARILEIARTYESYGKVDTGARWAPTLCMAPPPPAPRMSASRDDGTHGRKLYYLFAKDGEAYRAAGQFPQPEGQVLVKESWVPEEGAPRAKSALFLMIKSKSGAGTDEGWTYATVDPEGRRVTAAGRLAACMKCHEEAPRDRMFGLPVARLGK